MPTEPLLGKFRFDTAKNKLIEVDILTMLAILCDFDKKKEKRKRNSADIGRGAGHRGHGHHRLRAGSHGF